MNFSFFRKKPLDEASNNITNSSSTTNRNSSSTTNTNATILEAFKEFGNQTGVTMHWSDDEDDNDDDDDDDDDDFHNDNDSINNKTNSIKGNRTKGSPIKANKFNIPDNDIGLNAKHQVLLILLILLLLLIIIILM